MKFSNPFKKKQQPIPDEDIRNDEDLQGESSRYEDLVNQERDDDYEEHDNRRYDDYSDLSFDRYRETGELDNPFSGSEQTIDTAPLEKEAKRGRRLKGGLVAGIVAAIAMIAVGAMAYNFLKPKEGPIIQRGQGPTRPAASADVETTPGSSLPSSYSDLSKYEAEMKQREREELIKSGRLNPAAEHVRNVEAKQAKEEADKQRMLAAQNRQPNVTPPSRPSMPQNQGNTGYNQGYNYNMQPTQPRENPYAKYNTPVGFQVTESGKVTNNDSANSVFTAFPGTAQAVGKKYTITSGTIIPVTLITGLTSDSQSAGVTAQVRQDVYDSLTGNHLLIPQGSKVIGKTGGKTGRRMAVTFDRIILPNGASIKLSGPYGTDGQGYTGLRDKYDEKWGPTMKGAFLSGIIAGIADMVGDIDTRVEDGTTIQSAWGTVATKIGDRLSEKADALDKDDPPAIKVRPGFQFNVFLTEDIQVFGYTPYTGESR